MTVKSLEQTDFNDIVNAFNEAFAEYFVKINLNKKQLLNKMTLENIRLQHSVGAFDDGQLVGLILSGIGDNQGVLTGYNGGTGVIPSHRGKGLTVELYTKLLEHYKKEKVQQGLLEVIVENIPAIKTYEKVGFKKLRTLDCFKGQMNFEKPEIDKKIIARQVKNPNWKILESFWNWHPTWPNTRASVQRAGAALQLMGLYKEEELLAYGVINIRSGRIAQFGVHPDYRGKGLGKTLFYYLGKLGNPKLSIINVDQSDKDSIEFLQKIGFSRYIQQFEMGMQLS